MCFFFHRKAIYKNAYEGLHKSTESHWNSFKNVNLECQSIWYFNRNTIFSRMNFIFFSDSGNVTFKCVLSGEHFLCFFRHKGNIISITFIHIYKRSYFYVFFEKDHLSISVYKKYIIFSGKKGIPTFPILQERSYSSAIFSGRPSFQNI